MNRLKSNIYTAYFFGIFGVITVLFSSCSQEKNTLVNRTYHNLNAHYNGYYNGEEAWRLGVQKLEANYKPDYYNLLPVFIYGTEDEVQAIYTDMDLAVEKASRTIQRHSMYIRKKEHCNWIDDCYFLIGRSFFYKQEYQEAITNLKYVTRAFPNDVNAYHAQLYLTRIHLQKKEYEKARIILDQLNEAKKFPEELNAEFHQIFADYFIQKEDWDQATQELEKSLTYIKKKKDKVRLVYILAQLYALDGNKREANRYFAMVPTLNPPYELEFYAKINRALNYDKAAAGSRDIKETLNKMLVDDKNIEYKDQILYALAEIAFQENKPDEALSLLKMSTKESVNNPKQKGKSFLKIADYYYGLPEYRPAQQYYDSAITFLDKEHPRFEEIALLQNNLTKIVEQIEIIEYQDSLQSVANMSEKDREKLAKKLRDDYKKEQDRLEREKNAIQETLPQGGSTGAGPGAGLMAGLPNNNFYFYNEMAKNLGYSEFLKAWGERKNEDDWRRSKKQIVNFDSPTNEVDSLEESKDNSDYNAELDPENPLSIAFYLKNIPTGDSAIVESNKKIENALYELGSIYKYYMEDYPKSIESFEEILSRFNSSEHHLASYYQLYLLNKDYGSTQKAEYYKNLILTDYADSEYARLILDPTGKKEDKYKQEVEAYYKKTFGYYERGYHKQALLNCQESKKLYPNNEFKAKFSLLEALCIGKEQGKEALIGELNKVVQNHTNTPEAERATELLTQLNRAPEKPKNEEAPQFTISLESKHNVVFFIPASEDYKSINNSISDFNKKYFSLQKLSASVVLFNEQYQMITVKSFDNQESALKYFKMVQKDGTILKAIKQNNYPYFIITFDNYAELYKTKNIEEYQKFHAGSYE